MAQAALFLILGTAGTLLLQLAGGVLGPFGAFLNLLVPVPAAYVWMRCGAAVGGGAFGLAVVALTLLGGPGSGVAFLLQFAIGSATLCWLLRTGRAWDKAVLAAFVVTVMVSLAALVGYTASRGTSISTAVATYVQNEKDAALALAAQGDLTPEQAEHVREVVVQMAEFLSYTLPAWAALVTGILLLVQVMLLFALARGQYRIQGPPFPDWKTPELLIWPLIAAGFAVAFGFGLIRAVGLNFLVVMLPLYFVQGLAVVAFYFRKKGVSTMMRSLGYIFLVLFNPMPLIVTGIGIFDLWADFRKPRLKKT